MAGYGGAYVAIVRKVINKLLRISWEIEEKSSMKELGVLNKK